MTITTTTTRHHHHRHRPVAPATTLVATPPAAAHHSTTIITWPHPAIVAVADATNSSSATAMPTAVTDRRGRAVADHQS